MRTKSLIAAGAFVAAGMATSMAQSVYSLNVVGYVNVPIEANQLNLVSNPLKPSNDNYSINNTVVMPDTGADSLIYKWGGASWLNQNPIYFDTVTKWDTDGDTFTLDPGTAIFILGGPVNSTVTFVGEVRQGTNSNQIIPVGNSVRASLIPVAERIPGTATGGDDDVILTWNQGLHNWDANAWIYIGPDGWFDSGGVDLAGPLVGVGTGIFYQNEQATSAGTVAWNRNFTVAP